MLLAGAPSVTDWIIAVGTAVYGLSTAALVAAGVYAARAWRSQMRASRRAEVAGEALIAILNMIATLHRLSSMYPNSDHMVADVDQRWAAVALDQKAFEAVTGRVIAFLSADAGELVADVWAAFRELRAQQWVWALAIDTGEGDAAALFKKAFGPDVEARLDELGRRARKLLQPVARLEA